MDENNTSVDVKDVHEESWKLNDKDISETEYNSAEVVAYSLIILMATVNTIRMNLTPFTHAK